MTPPNAVTDEMLMALADRELPEADAARVRAAIATDPGLARRYGAFLASRRALAGLHREALQEPVPPALLAAVQAMAAAAAPAPEAAPARDAAEERGSVLPFRPRPPAPAASALPARPAPNWRGLAVAACLMLALGGVVGFGLGRQQGNGGLAGLDPVGRAAPALAAALEGAPSGAARPWAGGSVAILHTHLVGDVACREFDLTEGASLISGLACREGGAWRTRLVLARPPGEATTRPAGAEEPLVRELLDRLGAGPALGAAEERAAIGRGWR